MNRETLPAKLRPGLGRGLTKVEIILLIVLFVLVVASVGHEVGMGEMGDMRSMGGSGSNSASDVARFFVTRTITPLLEAYRHDMGDYPTTAQGLQALLTAPAGVVTWKGPYLLNENKIPRDPWGHPYQYAYPGAHSGKSRPDVSSLGEESHGPDAAEYIGNW